MINECENLKYKKCIKNYLTELSNSAKSIKWLKMHII